MLLGLWNTKSLVKARIAKNEGDDKTTSNLNRLTSLELSCLQQHPNHIIAYAVLSRRLVEVLRKAPWRSDDSDRTYGIDGGSTWNPLPINFNEVSQPAKDS